MLLQSLSLFCKIDLTSKISQKWEDSKIFILVFGVRDEIEISVTIFDEFE